jgi:hypothetical protein
MKLSKSMLFGNLKGDKNKRYLHNRGNRSSDSGLDESATECRCNRWGVGENTKTLLLD